MGLTFRVTNDILQNVVAAALQMLVGIAGYFHAAGRRMKSPNTSPTSVIAEAKP